MSVVHFKKKPYDVYIGRPSEWGNPFEIGRDGTRGEVILMYEVWIRSQRDLVARCKRELKGKALGCWCSPKKCHGDVLTMISEETDEQSEEKMIVLCGE